MNITFFRYRIALLISLLIILPLGYVIRFAADTWLNDFLGSVAYEVLWILWVLLLFPKASLGWTALGVCLSTCVLEFLQLWQHPVYLAAKATFLGRLILGSTFMWSDFPSYFAGSWVGWRWAKWLRQRWAGR